MDYERLIGGKAEKADKGGKADFTLALSLLATKKVP